MTSVTSPPTQRLAKATCSQIEVIAWSWLAVSPAWPLLGERHESDGDGDDGHHRQGGDVAHGEAEHGHRRRDERRHQPGPPERELREEDAELAP